MAAYFDAEDLPGFAHWMQVQFQEELGHARKFYGHINDRGGRVKLAAIEEPQAEWDSPLAAFQAAYQHEQHISGRINDLVDLAAEIDDHAANPILQWFVEEQIEEEASTDAVVKLLEKIQDSPHGLIMLDRQLAQRGE